MSYCTQCGLKNTDTDKFCTKCGKSVNEETVESTKIKEPNKGSLCFKCRKAIVYDALICPNCEKTGSKRKVVSGLLFGLGIIFLIIFYSAGGRSLTPIPIVGFLIFGLRILFDRIFDD